MAYTIEFAESVKAQLQSLTAAERAKIFDSIERHLTHEPFIETKNRKPLRPNPVAPWELRLGALRVFYDVVSDDPNVVRILAVGKKKGSKLIIEDKVIEL